MTVTRQTRTCHMGGSWSELLRVSITRNTAFVSGQSALEGACARAETSRGTALRLRAMPLGVLLAARGDSIAALASICRGTESAPLWLGPLTGAGWAMKAALGANAAECAPGVPPLNDTSSG